MSGEARSTHLFLTSFQRYHYHVELCQLVINRVARPCVAHP